MMILAGLGNPGPEYASNRHNVGFMLLDRIASLHGFTPRKIRVGADCAEGILGGRKVLLIKPLEYMNRSGRALRAVMDFRKIGVDALTVAHDDIDLAPGKVRVKRGGGHGGHNGLRDIDRHCGPDYRRLRIGVGRHPHANAHDKKVDAHVLSDFTEAEMSGWLDGLLDCMAREIDLLYGDGDDDDNNFMTAVARHCPPSSPQENKGGA